MKGQPPKAFPQQNHKAHMKAHAEFMFTRMVQINPQLYAMMESHILEHIALMAAEQVEQEIEEQTQQITNGNATSTTKSTNGTTITKQAQQNVIEKKESRIAKLEAEMVKEMAKEEEEEVVT